MSRLAKINWNDATNGNGVCVSIFVQGCPHHCPGCFNLETWDPAGGQSIDFPKFIKELIDKIQENGIERGLSFLGGEPLVSYNLEFVDKVITIIKTIYPSTPIYIWTGDIYEHHEQDARYNPVLRHILSLTDVLIDGPYQEDKRDITLYLRGSSNQRVIDVQQSLQKGETVLLCD